MQSEVESQIKDCFILLEHKLTQIHMKLNSLDARVESVENTTTFLREKIRNFSFQTSEMECPKTPNRQKCEVSAAYPILESDDSDIVDVIAKLNDCFVSCEFHLQRQVRKELDMVDTRMTSVETRAKMMMELLRKKMETLLAETAKVVEENRLLQNYIQNRRKIEEASFEQNLALSEENYSLKHRICLLEKKLQPRCIKFEAMSSPAIPFIVGCNPQRKMNYYEVKDSSCMYHDKSRKLMETSLRHPLGDFNSLLSRRIFVGQVPSKITDGQILSYFKAFGTVVDVYRPSRQNSSRKKYIYVTFSARCEMDRCVGSRPHIIQGYELNVSEATPRPVSHVKSGYGGFLYLRESNPHT